MHFTSIKLIYCKYSRRRDLLNKTLFFYNYEKPPCHVACKILNPYISEHLPPSELQQKPITMKPVCNDHLYNKIYYLWFIQ